MILKFPESIARRYMLRSMRVLLCAAFVLLSGAVLLAGCSKDLPETNQTPVVPELPQPEQGELSMSISVEGVSSAAPGTYALTPEQEGFVDKDQFNVLLFSADPDQATGDTGEKKYTFVQYVEAQERADDGTGTTEGHYVRHFTITLPDAAEYEGHEYMAMVVANYTPETLTEGTDRQAAWARLLNGRTLASARELITFSMENGQPWKTGTDRTPLPLCGVTANPFNAQMIRVSTIQMLRAVARIDVGVNLGGALLDEEGNPTGAYDLTSAAYNGRAMDLDGHTFELKSVTLYNSSSNGRMAPDKDKMTPDYKSVSEPTLPENLQKHETPVQYTYSDANPNAATNMLRGEIYLPETQNKVDDDAQAFYIVIGGSYNGGATTYYRVDFYNRAADADVNQGQTGTEHEDYVKPSAANRYDILRNHAYVINILRVRGEGYPTAAMAASSEPINMEVDIRSWDTGDNMSNVVTDGQYRLSLSDIQLRYYMDGSAQDLEIYTDFRLEDNPDASGWKLLMPLSQIAGEDDYNHADDVQVWVETDTGWEQVSRSDDMVEGSNICWTRGIANVTGRVRLGLSRFDDGNASGLMERTVRLVVTAGRMSQTVELVQDVRNTRTLNLLQQKLYFPKYPTGNQSVVVKSSPEGAVYYVAWTKDGKSYRANISNPEAEPVPGREGDLGGINKVQADEFPTGFVCDDHPEEESCQAIEFFKAVVGGGNMFTLRPSDWDAQHTADAAEPQQPRSWRFDIEGYWDTAETPDLNPERAKLDVEQSNYEVKWWVSDAGGGGAQLSPKQQNYVIVPYNIGTATPVVSTVPETLAWYFLAMSDEGNLSGQKWVKNWEKGLMNVTHQNSPNTVTVELENNPSIQSRTVTFKAGSAADGFDREGSTLTIEQQGCPLTLTLENAIGQGFSFDNNKTYTLDFGTTTARTLLAASVRANSDWWWEWRQADGVELGDKSVDKSGYLDDYGKNKIHLHRDHPYWDNTNAPSESNPGYIVSSWMGDLSAVPNPGFENGTDVNGDKNSYDRKWSEALSFRSVAGVYLSSVATSDETLTARMIPLAGTYYSEIQLYNRHKFMHEDEDYAKPMVGDQDWQSQIDAATKILRVQRTVPSFTFFAEKPFDGVNNVNLSNFTTEELGTTADDPALWDKQTLSIRSNNRVKISLSRKTLSDPDWVPFKSVDFDPVTDGYSEVFTATLGELGNGDDMKSGDKFINPDDVPYSAPDAEFTRYKIEISGYRQRAKDQADEAFTEVLEYCSSYWMEHPLTPQIIRGGQYVSEGFELLFDFSASAYPKDQKIRIGRRSVALGDYNGAGALSGNGVLGEKTYTTYVLNGALNQRYIKYTVPTNNNNTQMYIYWVEFLPADADNTEWSTAWDAGTASLPEKGQYLFLQDATQYGGYVFLQNGPQPPAIAYNNQIVKNIENKGSMSEGKATIYFYPEYLPSYETYKKNYTDSFTGAQFVTTCGLNEEAEAFNSQTVVNYSKQARGKDGSVFLSLHVKATGKHNCVGSRQHTRSSVQDLQYQPWFYSACPDGHGITRPWIQIWERVDEAYYNTVSGGVTNIPQLIIVRRGFSGRGTSLPYYNTNLEGTKEN